MTQAPELTGEDRTLDAIYADLDAAGVAQEALSLLEYLAAALGDSAVLDRTTALRRRLQQGMPDARYGRGRCPRCLRSFALNGDGSIRAHRTAAGRPCQDRKGGRP